VITRHRHGGDVVVEMVVSNPVHTSDALHRALRAGALRHTG
jgi:hypothetical protein